MASWGEIASSRRESHAMIMVKPNVSHCITFRDEFPGSEFNIFIKLGSFWSVSAFAKPDFLEH